MAAPIVVVGAVSVDLGLKVQRFPAVGHTVAGSHLALYYGGKGALQASACAKLGGRVALVAQVGVDPFALRLKKHLATNGINVSQIHRLPRQATGFNATLINSAGQCQEVRVPGANALFTPVRLESARPLLESARLVLLQLDLPLATIEAAARIAKKAGAVVILDPTPPQDLSDEFLRLIDYLTPGEAELAFLTGAPLDDLPRLHAVHKANEMLARGAKKVIVKMGLQGALLVTGNLQHLWRPHSLHRADVTAAGDTFNAALAVAL
jgi:ribokinase